MLTIEILREHPVYQQLSRYAVACDMNRGQKASLVKRFIINYNSCNPRVLSESLVSVQTSFIWNVTPEGQRYWYEVYLY